MPREGKQKLLNAVLRGDAFEGEAFIGSDEFLSHLGSEEELHGARTAPSEVKKSRRRKEQHDNSSSSAKVSRTLVRKKKSRKNARPAQKMVKASRLDLGRNTQKGGSVSRRLPGAGRPLPMTTLDRPDLTFWPST